MTLVVSDINAIAVWKLSPFAAKACWSASKKLDVVPVLTTGLSVDLVRTSPTLGSRNLARIIQDLAVLSLDSSISNENGVLLNVSTTLR